ncbi:MAG: hypothetical protein WBO10_10715 [Pyrinomonadaceae bacterium]
MSATLTVELPEDVRSTLGKAAREDGISEKAFAVRALQDYLFLRRFRKLRTEMITESEKTYTDNRIFALVS